MKKTGSASRAKPRSSKGRTGQQSPSPSKPSEQRPFEVRKRPRASAALALLEKTEPAIYALLYGKLRALAVKNPYPMLGPKLGEGQYRVKEGHWRARVLVDDTQRIIMVTAVVRRNEATYR